MKTIKIIIPKELEVKLAMLAKTKSTSFSNVIRDILQLYFKEV